MYEFNCTNIEYGLIYGSLPPLIVYMIQFIWLYPNIGLLAH